MLAAILWKLYNLNTFKNSCSQMVFKIGLLKNFAIFTGIHLCWGHFLIKLQVLRPATLFKKTPTQVLSCEYCEIFKNSFFYRTRLVATSLLCKTKSCTPLPLHNDPSAEKTTLKKPSLIRVDGVEH